MKLWVELGTFWSNENNFKFWVELKKLGSNYEILKFRVEFGTFVWNHEILSQMRKLRDKSSHLKFGGEFIIFA